MLAHLQRLIARRIGPKRLFAGRLGVELLRAAVLGSDAEIEQVVTDLLAPDPEDPPTLEDLDAP